MKELRGNCIIFALITVGCVYSQCWITTYNGPANDDDLSYNLVISQDSSVYVTGYSKGISTNSDYCTIKYNGESGIEEWVRGYNGSANGDDCALAITTDCSGNVYVTGLAEFVETYNDIVTLKYNSNGELKWTARYSGSSDDFGSDVVCDTQGNVYVTGYSYTGLRQYPVAIKYDSNGVQKWAVKDTNRGWTVSIGLDIQGNVYAAGYQIVRDSAHYSIIKYDSTGAIQWRAGDNIQGYAYKLKVNFEGDVYVTGTSGISPGNWRLDIVTAKYNTFGQEQWVQVYDDSVNGWDEGQSLTIDNQGNVYVVGPSATEQGAMPYFDFVIIKYNSYGTLRWVRRYDGFGSDDYPFDVEVDNQKNVYVCGYSVGFNDNDDATIVKYDSFGNQEWDARNNGPGNSDGWLYGLALDEQDYIYATGYIYSTNTLSDFLTIKYSPSGPWISENPKDSNKYGQIIETPSLFRNTTTIKYLVKSRWNASLNVYDITGRLVRSLLSDIQKPGTHTINWDGKDNQNKYLSQGIYFYRFQIEDFKDTKKVILFK